MTDKIRRGAPVCAPKYRAIFAAITIMIALPACTSHTRYYTTDGTRTTEIERTTHIGATRTDDPVGADLRVCPETHERGAQ